MKYGVYYHKNKEPFKRHCKIERNRKGLLAAYPITYASMEDAQFEADLLTAAGYEAKIKKVKA